MGLWETTRIERDSDLAVSARLRQTPVHKAVQKQFASQSRILRTSLPLQTLITRYDFDPPIPQLFIGIQQLNHSPEVNRSPSYNDLQDGDHPHVPANYLRSIDYISFQESSRRTSKFNIPPFPCHPSFGQDGSRFTHGSCRR